MPATVDQFQTTPSRRPGKPEGHHPEKRLTAAFVKNAKPGRHADGNGLYLVVEDTGAKRWVLRVVVHGRRRDIGLGGVLVVSLAEAREMARVLRAAARNGADPVAVRDKDKRHSPTFEEGARRYHSEQVVPNASNGKHVGQWIRTLETYAFPTIGGKPLHTVEQADILRILAPIWTEKDETARRVLQRLRTVLDWARTAGHRDGVNPCEGVEKGLARQKRRTEHFAALPWRDLPEVWRALEAREGMGVLALRFAILTAVRTKEVRGATWGEIDLAERVWTIPAERMKARKEHRVPLSEPALAILNELRVGAPAANSLIFSARAGRPLSENTLLAVLKRNRADWRERKDAADNALKDWEGKRDAALKAGLPPPPKPADPGPEPHVPVLAVNDATTQKLAMILAVQMRGLLQVRDELAGWLSDMVRYANGGSDCGFWLEAYGGRSYTVERVTRDPVTVERLSISVLGGIQPDRLATQLLGRRDDDGLLARFMVTWPAPVEPRIPDRRADIRFVRRAFERLYGLAMPLDATGTPAPITIPFTDDAQQALQALRLWARDAEREEAGLMVSLLGKTPGLAVRLALVLAHLDWAASSDPDAPAIIEVEHVERARKLVVDYAIPMARRAYAEASTPPEVRAARQLARLIAAERLEKFSLRDITRRERQGLKTHDDVEKAAEVLTQAGWLAPVKHPASPVGGRPKYVYKVNPAALKRH